MAYYYSKISSLALSGCKQKIFCMTARNAASALYSVKSKFIHSSGALLNATDKKRLIPGDGVGPELVHPVLEVLKGVLATPDYGRTGESQTLNIKLERALNLYANVVHVKSLLGVKSRYENVDRVIRRFYSNSANEADKSSADKSKIQIDEVMILEYTKNSKRSQLCKVKNVNNLYCYLNVRCLHVGSTLQALNGQMTVDFEEKLKLNKLPCSIEKKLDAALQKGLLRQSNELVKLAFETGLETAKGILLPEVMIRDEKLRKQNKQLERLKSHRKLLIQREATKGALVKAKLWHDYSCKTEYWRALPFSKVVDDLLERADASSAHPEQEDDDDYTY